MSVQAEVATAHVPVLHVPLVPLQVTERDSVTVPVWPVGHVPACVAAGLVAAEHVYVQLELAVVHPPALHDPLLVSQVTDRVRLVLPV